MSEPKDATGINVHLCDEYHRYGGKFYGKLVVADYTVALESDPRSETFSASVTFDHAEKALDLLKERYGEHIEILQAVPELICRLPEDEVLQHGYE